MMNHLPFHIWMWATLVCVFAERVYFDPERDATDVICNPDMGTRPRLKTVPGIKTIASCINKLAPGKLIGDACFEVRISSLNLARRAFLSSQIRIVSNSPNSLILSELPHF
jgi:hypothetical protein